MSNFSVEVTLIDALHPIEGADAIELAQIRGYKAIVRKGTFTVGEKVIYIPTDSILPESLIAEFGMTGKLAGSKKNRVKAIRLRGVLSEGVIIKCDPSLELGSDQAEAMGITKYEMVIPKELTGKVVGVQYNISMSYDIEAFKNYPDLIQEGEDVVITEKLHGVCAIFTLLPEEHWFSRTFREIEVPGSYDRETGIETLPIFGPPQTVDNVDFFAASKGLAKNGLVFVLAENKNNVYCDTAVRLNIRERMKESFLIPVLLKDGPVHLFGEIFGPGVQDLHYDSYDAKPSFRVFDIYVGLREQGRFLNDEELEMVLSDIELPRVPVLYRGPFKQEILEELTNGKETISGKQLHIREGVVVRTLREHNRGGFVSGTRAFNGFHGRTQLKSVSSDYLLRKNPNATEYQ